VECCEHGNEYFVSIKGGNFTIWVIIRLSKTVLHRIRSLLIFILSLISILILRNRNRLFSLSLSLSLVLNSCGQNESQVLTLSKTYRTDARKDIANNGSISTNFLHAKQMF
jgi:hypothetical protein